MFVQLSEIASVERITHTSQYYIIVYGAAVVVPSPKSTPSVMLTTLGT